MSMGGREQQVPGTARSSTTHSDQESPGADESGHTSPQNEPKLSFDPSMADVEAMIARAAAQASQSLGPDWS